MDLRGSREAATAAVTPDFGTTPREVRIAVVFYGWDGDRDSHCRDTADGRKGRVKMQDSSRQRLPVLVFARGGYTYAGSAGCHELDTPVAMVFARHTTAFSTTTNKQPSPNPQPTKTKPDRIGMTSRCTAHSGSTGLMCPC